MSRLLHAIDTKAERLGSFVLNYKEASFRPQNAQGGFTSDKDEDTLPTTPDAGLARGSIVLETGHGWIEDGPAVRLERLRAELDRMGAPQ